MRVNLTTIVPEGFMHHHAFDEVRDSLSWALTALGHDVSLTENWFSESGETNLILGAELIADFQRLPPSSIIFNLEQPSHPNMAKVIRMAQESHCTVWDYSMRSVDEWRRLNVDVRHVPIGWTPNLTRIPASDSYTWDVSFFGWSTPRRRALISQLEASGLKVYASASCYGGARDNVISRSKVCLNVHHDGRDRFEIVRASYLLANAKLVVTETSSDDDEYSSLSDGLVRTPYRMLVDACASYCRDSAAQERRRYELKGQAFIRRRDFTEAVGAALDTTPASTQSRSKLLDHYDAACASGDMKDFMEYLYQHAEGNVVEIGVRGGASTSALLLGVIQRGGHLYSIDVDDCSLVLPVHPQWTFIRGDSHSREVYDQVPQDIDLLLIDGDHSHNGVFTDFNAYSKWVRPGGLILFHDIAPEPNPGNVPDWPDDSVRRFYESLCAAGWEHEELPGRYGMGVLKVPAEVTVK